MSRILKMACVQSMLIALAACGGGGGDTPPTPTTGTTPSPTATPLPSTSISPNPSASITVSPAPLEFTTVGYSLTFVASEPSYTGTFTASSTDCNGIASFTPATAIGPNATFSVTSASAGECHVTISDAAKNTTTVRIDVTTTSGTVQ